MKQALKKYKAWQSQRKVSSLAQWERTRAKGKGRFVWDGAWRYCLIIIPAMAYMRYFSEGTMQSWQSAAFWGQALRYFVTGAFVALFSWGDMEFKYNKARRGHSTTPADLSAPPPDPSSNPSLLGR